MLRRLSGFHVDYSKESHLILPFPTLPKGSEAYEDGEGSIFIISYSYLFAVTDKKHIDIEPFLSDIRLKHFIFPSEEPEGSIRYLMHKKQGILTGNPEAADTAALADFYDKTEFYDSDEEYLAERKEAGEYFFTVKDKDGSILAAAYTNKDRRVLVNVATREDMRGKGYATALLKNTPSVYLFAETDRLRDFYQKRGFETVRRYRTIDRRVEA